MVMDPGQRFTTSRGRLASALMAQEQAAAPIQSHTQGLASLLRQGLAGFMQGRDERDRSAMQRELMRGLTAKPWINPDTGQVAPGQPQAGGYAGAMAALANMPGNEYAAQMLPQLGMAQFQQDEARRAAEAERAARMQDYRTQKQIDQEFAPPPDQYEIIQNPYGMGGAAQRNTRTGQITGHVAPPQPREPRRPDDFERWLEVNPGKNYNDFLQFQQDQAVRRAEASAGARPLTDAESKAGTFALRMEGATENVNAVMNGPDGVPGTADDYNPTNAQDMASGAVGVGFLMTPEGKRFRQAQEDWVTANLRRESGAVIGKEEMEQEIDKYFPRFGDTPDVIAQKAQSRARAEAGMRAQAGRAYDEIRAQFGGNAQPVQIGPNGEGYDNLPSGTRFIDPNGQLRIKP